MKPCADVHRCACNAAQEWWETPFTSRRNIAFTMLAGSAGLWLLNNSEHQELASACHDFSGSACACVQLAQEASGQGCEGASQRGAVRHHPAPRSRLPPHGPLTTPTGHSLSMPCLQRRAPPAPQRATPRLH